MAGGLREGRPLTGAVACVVKRLRGEYESRFLTVYEAMSGGVPPEEVAFLPDVVCAETAIVGIEPESLLPFSLHLKVGAAHHTMHCSDVPGALDDAPPTCMQCVRDR